MKGHGFLLDGWIDGRVSIARYALKKQHSDFTFFRSKPHRTHHTSPTIFKMLENQSLCAEKQEEHTLGGIPTPLEIFATKPPDKIASKDAAFAENWSQVSTYSNPSFRPRNMILTVSKGKEDIRGNNRTLRQLQHLPKRSAA
jgi:hypothetical protein